MLNNKYKISVIVPAYNIKDYLPRCLDSILNQTYTNLEVIVISDGSTDGTNEVIKDYEVRDSRIIAILKENTGVSDTRNKGLKIATGDYIGFVDGDDYIEPEMYETLLKNALDNNADISHCGYQMVFPSRVDYYYNTGKKVVQDNEKGVYDIIKGEYIEPSLATKLYKREVINNVRMPEHIKMNEDVIFNVCAFINAKKSFYEDKPLYHYILRKGSATTSNHNYSKLFDTLELSKLIIEKCEGYNDEIKSVATARQINSIIVSYRNIKLFRLKEYYKEIETYRLSLRRIKGINVSRKLKIEKFLVSYIPAVYIGIYSFYNNFISKSTSKFEVK